MTFLSKPRSIPKYETFCTEYEYVSERKLPLSGRLKVRIPPGSGVVGSNPGGGISFFFLLHKLSIIGLHFVLFRMVCQSQRSFTTSQICIENQAWFQHMEFNMYYKLRNTSSYYVRLFQFTSLLHTFVGE